MTVLARRDGAHRLLQLLVACHQIREWSDYLDDLHGGENRIGVLYGRERRVEADELAAALSAPCERLSRAHRLETHLGRGDLVVVISSAGGGRPSPQSMAGLSALHRLLHRGVVIWGITGPRPNPISPFCHDSLAVPEADPSLLLRAHRLVVRQLVTARRPSAPTRLVAADEGSPW